MNISDTFEQINPLVKSQTNISVRCVLISFLNDSRYPGPILGLTSQVLIWLWIPLRFHGNQPSDSGRSTSWCLPVRSAFPAADFLLTVSLKTWPGFLARILDSPQQIPGGQKVRGRGSGDEGRWWLKLFSPCRNFRNEVLPASVGTFWLLPHRFWSKPAVCGTSGSGQPA